MAGEYGNGTNLKRVAGLNLRMQSYNWTLRRSKAELRTLGHLG